MKQICLTALAVFSLLCSGDLLKGQTIWNGPSVTFTKPDSADWTLAENQDRITGEVWITRGNNKPIFNIADEEPESWSASPKGTLWAAGSITDGVENLIFDSWANAIQGNPPGSVGKNMVLFLTQENIYIDIKFTSWTSGGGGGFSYVRSTEGSTSTADEMLLAPGLKCYPNPAGNFLYVSGTDESSLLTVELYTLTGKKVAARTQSGREAISVGHLPGGMYIYRLINGNTVESGSVVIE